MVVSIMIVINIVFLSVLLIIRRRLKKNRVRTKRTLNILNCVLALMFISYIVLNYVLLLDYAAIGYWDPTEATIRARATTFLLYSPFLWMSLIHFWGRTLLYTRINNKAKVRGDVAYYRDDLSKVHPGLLSLLYNFRAGESSDITAVLLKLKLEGYLAEKDGALHATDKDADALLDSEKLVLSAVSSKSFDLRQYAETVKREARELGLINRTGNDPGTKKLKIFLTCALSFTVIIAAIIATATISSTYVYRGTRTSALYVAVEKSVYDEYDYRNTERSSIDEIVMAAIGQTSNPRTSYDESADVYYVRADLLGGFHALVGNRDAMNVVRGLSAVLCVVLVIAAIALVSSQFRFFKYDFTRTLAGTKLINDAIGLKNFLKDFSAIKGRTAEELALWEYYLVYAVVLDVNIKVEDSVISAFSASLQ